MTIKDRVKELKRQKKEALYGALPMMTYEELLDLDEQIKFHIDRAITRQLHIGTKVRMLKVEDNAIFGEGVVVKINQKKVKCRFPKHPRGALWNVPKSFLKVVG